MRTEVALELEAAGLVRSLEPNPRPYCICHFYSFFKYIFYIDFANLLVRLVYGIDNRPSERGL